MAARGQRRLAARAMASERAYSPMPYVPDTGTNRIRGAGLSKGGEPSIQNQQGPGSAKLRSDRTLQNAAIHQSAYRVAQHLRMPPQPSMHRESKSGFRLIQVA